MSWINSFRNVLLYRQSLTDVSRSKIRTPTGGIISEPPRVPFGLFGVVCTVVSGLLIGATISKNIASFLEENDLFVPSDDDDDDD